MDKDTVIKVEHVSKKYCKSLKKSMYYGAMDIGRNMLGVSSKSERLRKDEFWALSDVSFEVKKGETLGIIGPNGSGKTTLLKLLNGIFWPDKGKITIKGRVGALIELGAGFHPLLTGRDNIYINAAILGMTKKEVDKKFDEIVEFADIGDFLDTPVKYYSSGMFVKLGFAVAIHSNPDILLVDEVLAVGDVQFQVKCFRKFTEFKEVGKTIVLVTHDMGTIQKQAGKVLLLLKGTISEIDSPKNSVNKYLAIMSGGVKDIKETKIVGKSIKSGDKSYQINDNSFSSQIDVCEDRCTEKLNYNKNEFRYGNGFAQIIDFQILNTQGKEVTSIMSRDIILFRVKVRGYKFIKNPIIGIIVKTKEGLELYGNNTLYSNIDIPSLNHGKELLVEYKIQVTLQPGDYFLSAGVAAITSDGIVPVDRRYDFVHLEVLQSDRSFGLVNLATEIKVYSEDFN